MLHADDFSPSHAAIIDVTPLILMVAAFRFDYYERRRPDFAMPIFSLFAIFAAATISLPFSLRYAPQFSMPLAPLSFIFFHFASRRRR